MSLYNPEIHHRKSIRLKGYDYSQPGSYFVTINIDDLRYMLAVWMDGMLKLLPIGEIVQKYWLEIPTHYPGVNMDEYVIMPDHLHGVLSIVDNMTLSSDRKGVQLNAPTTAIINNESDIQQLNAPTGTTKNESNMSQSHTTTANVIVATAGNTAKQTDPYYAALSPTGGTLSVIIRNYKASITRWCKTNGYPQFKWQRNYHEHIIRNDEELQRIRKYIRNNPAAFLEEFPGLKG